MIRGVVGLLATAVFVSSVGAVRHLRCGWWHLAFDGLIYLFICILTVLHGVEGEWNETDVGSGLW